MTGLRQSQSARPPVPIKDRKAEGIRNKLIEKFLDEPACGDSGCPGWAVFDTGSLLELEVCDACWSADPDPLTDEEVALLPEAQRELALARAQGEAYVYPFVDRRGPCTHCGGYLWRGLGGEEQYCCDCGVVRLMEWALQPGDPTCKCGERMRPCDMRGHDGKPFCWHCDGCGGYHCCPEGRGTAANCNCAGLGRCSDE